MVLYFISIIILTIRYDKICLNVRIYWIFCLVYTKYVWSVLVDWKSIYWWFLCVIVSVLSTLFEYTFIYQKIFVVNTKKIPIFFNDAGDLITDQLMASLSFLFLLSLIRFYCSEGSLDCSRNYLNFKRTSVHEILLNSRPGTVMLNAIRSRNLTKFKGR